MEILLGIIDVLLCVALSVILNKLDEAKVKLDRALKEEAELTNNMKTYYRPFKASWYILMKVDYIPKTIEDVERMANMVYIVNTVEIILNRPIAWSLIKLDSLSNEAVKELADNIKNSDKTEAGIFPHILGLAYWEFDKIWEKSE